MAIGIVVAVKILVLIQASQSSISGTISDAETGQPLADAIVSLTDVERAVASDSLGRYTFLEVPPGPQHLTIRRIGYAPRIFHALVPGEGRLEINIALEPIPMQLATIVVQSALAVRGVESEDSTPFPERGVSMAAVRNDPFLAEPDGLLGLTGGEIAASPESPSGLHLRGAASDQTRYLLDGIPILSPYHAAGTFSAWNPDALDRLEASSAFPSPDVPDALSGTVSATTRPPGSSVRTQGGMSTTQARLAMDGPLGRAGYLVSFRTGYPALLAPRHEASYLKGDTHDLIAKLEGAALGGHVRFVLYDAGNSIGSSAGASGTSGTLPNNAFEWSSRSFGGQWVGRSRGAAFRLQLWSASSEAEATWIADAPLGMTAGRRDEGFQAVVDRTGTRSTKAGLRIERSCTEYRVIAEDGGGTTFELAANTPVTTVFLQHGQPLGEKLRADGSISAASAAGAIHLNFQSQLRWQLSAPVALSASFARSHQFYQSLRNSESVAGNIFPPDLYVGAGARGVPVARNDRAVLAADYHPLAGLRLGAQAYVSHYTGLVLVAPQTRQPFATDGFATGSGTAPGFSLDAAWSEARYGLVARYGWQRVRLKHSDSSYTPAYGTSHVMELGGIIFPSATSSVRLAITGGLGRHATGTTGSFEWESCNLLDRGCEFLGSPETAGTTGAVQLPAYLRLDLSARKHWHLHIGGRDVTLALFGTMTNLLGRTNVLTVATDPASDRQTAVEMRPRAPLLVGLDWRF